MNSRDETPNSRDVTPTDALARIRVVLHRPSHPGNVGAAARALKTMGLSRLVLVAPRRAPGEEARALAAGAIDVLEGARVCATLEEALQGVALAIAFSARSRELSHRQLDVRSAAVEAVESAGRGEVALVFGNETAGLSNQDVMLCNRLAHILTDAGNRSLNLAAAVQVAAYEARMAAIGPAKPQREVELAPLEDVEQLYEHFERSLRVTGFLDPGKPKRLMERLRRLFSRARLEREEVSILRGVLSAFEETLESRKTGRKS
jgi:tRNA/rRNA methyltransferase